MLLTQMGLKEYPGPLTVSIPMSTRVLKSYSLTSQRSGGAMQLVSSGSGVVTPWVMLRVGI